jgi:hypothetical protein
MPKLISLILIGFLIFGLTLKKQPWDTEDKALFSIFTVGHAIDYFQTKEIKKNGKELNPWLRDMDSKWIPWYFLGTACGVKLFVDHLKYKYHKLFLRPFTGLKVFTVGRNFALGVKFQM